MNKKEIKDYATGFTMREITEFVKTNNVTPRYCYFTELDTVDGKQKFLVSSYGERKVFNHELKEYVYDLVNHNYVFPLSEAVEGIVGKNNKRIRLGDEDKVFLCQICGYYEKVEAKKVVDGIETCPSCYNLNVKKCVHCGEVHFINNLKSINFGWDKYICKNCLENSDKYKVCSCCNRVYEAYKMKTVDGKEVCPSCYSSNTTKCFLCGEVHFVSDMTTVSRNHGTVMVCKECIKDTENFVRCDICGELIVKDGCNEIDGKKICGKCYRENCYICDICCQPHLKSSASAKYYTGYNLVKTICSHCESQIEFVEACNVSNNVKKVKKSETIEIDGKFYFTGEARKNICGYHGYRSEMYEPHMVEGEKTEMFFGTEVETQGPDENSFYISESNVGDLFHMERDSSIGQGFEIISQPMSYNFIRAKYDDIAKAFKALSNAGQKSDQTTCCGLHIHVSRKAFKDDNAIQKAVAIITAYKENVEVLARRKNGHYYSYGNIEGIITKTKTEAVGQYGHSVAVNTSNTKTIEFRVFKGTLNPETYMATIEFVRNVVNMANSDKKIIKFKDLLEGEFLEDYVQNRISKGYELNLEKVLDFTAFNIDELKRLLKQKREVIEFIKAYNANPNNVVKIGGLL